MSRTDKTRPWWVKARDAYIEKHDHVDGVCDIAGQQPNRSNIGWRRGGKCYFAEWIYEPDFRCGMGLCGIPLSERRKQRYASRRVERDWWREM